MGIKVKSVISENYVKVSKRESVKDFPHTGKLIEIIVCDKEAYLVVCVVVDRAELLKAIQDSEVEL